MLKTVKEWDAAWTAFMMSLQDSGWSRERIETFKVQMDQSEPLRAVWDAFYEGAHDGEE